VDETGSGSCPVANLDLLSETWSTSVANLRYCPLQETVSSGSVHAYVLQPSSPGGHLVIHSIQADGVTHLQQFGVQSDSYFLWSWLVTVQGV
jgi:hypothetical protein